MNTFTWRADKEYTFMQAYSGALSMIAHGYAIDIQSFTAFKVNDLWVVTITYK